jgi:hypothetical protein
MGQWELTVPEEDVPHEPVHATADGDLGTLGEPGGLGFAEEALHLRNLQHLASADGDVDGVEDGLPCG